MKGKQWHQGRAWFVPLDTAVPKSQCYTSVAKQWKGAFSHSILGSSSLLAATCVLSQPKGGTKATTWTAEHCGEASFHWALDKQQIVGLVAKLEASSLPSAPRDLERWGMAVTRKLSKDALRLVQCPCRVHNFVLGQCKMHFVSNVVRELLVHTAGWEQCAS